MSGRESLTLLSLRETLREKGQPGVKYLFDPQRHHAHSMGNCIALFKASLEDFTESERRDVICALMSYGADRNGILELFLSRLGVGCFYLVWFFSLTEEQLSSKNYEMVITALGEKGLKQMAEKTDDMSQVLELYRIDRFRPPQSSIFMAALMDQRDEKLRQLFRTIDFECLVYMWSCPYKNGPPSRLIACS